MKLKYNFAAQTYSVQLYNEKPQGKRLAVHYGNANYYAPLIEPDNPYSSHLRVKFGDEVLAVAKEIYREPEPGEEVHVQVGDITVAGGDERLVFDGDYVLGSYETLDVDGTTNYKADICARDGTKVGTLTTPASYVVMKQLNGSNQWQYFNERGNFNNGNPRAATAVVMNSNRGDYGVQKNSDGSAHYNDDNANLALQTSEYYVNIASIYSNFYNSYVVSNCRNNNIYVAGGDENIIVGGLGNDSVEFYDGGGVFADYGINAPKSGASMTYAKNVTQTKTSDYYAYDRYNPGSYLCGADYLYLHGTVTGVYCQTTTSITASDNTTVHSNKVADINVLIVYNSSKHDDNIILLPHVNKAATTPHSSNPAKRVWQTHPTASGDFSKIWHGANADTQITVSSLRKSIYDFPEHLRSKAARLYQMYLNSNHVNKNIFNTDEKHDKFPDWT